MVMTSKEHDPKTNITRQIPVRVGSLLSSIMQRTRATKWSTKDMRKSRGMSDMCESIRFWFVLALDRLFWHVRIPSNTKGDISMAQIMVLVPKPIWLFFVIRVLKNGIFIIWFGSCSWIIESFLSTVTVTVTVIFTFTIISFWYVFINPDSIPAAVSFDSTSILFSSFTIVEPLILAWIRPFFPMGIVFLWNSVL